MAWRPHKYLLEGELDNTVAGKVNRMDEVRRRQRDGDLRFGRRLPQRYPRGEGPLVRPIGWLESILVSIFSNGRCLH
jgi:hypothetical protein